MNGSGEIIAHQTSKGETKQTIQLLLKIVKLRCDVNSWQYPSYIYTDNAQQQVYLNIKC